LESDENAFEKRLKDQERARQRRSDLLNGLTRRQRHFVLEKLLGHNDKDAALIAGYSLSVAENTKQRVWKPVVRGEFERLASDLASQFTAKKLRNLEL
jgi:phage terminase small subunit